MTFTPRMTRTARVALFLMTLLLAPRGQGTQVIMFVTEGWVVIAADSRFVIPGGASSTGCKIHQSDGRQFFWAASGIFFDKETGYSVDDFFRKVQRGKPLTTPQTLDAVGKLIAGPLLKEAFRLKVQAPDYYNWLVRNGGTMLSLFAVSVETHKVEGYEKDFNLVGGKIIPRLSHTCPPTQKTCVVMPPRAGVTRFVQDHPKLLDGDIRGVVDEMMAIAQAADPTYVGPPFSILGVTRNGPEWIRQNNCADLKSENTGIFHQQPNPPASTPQQGNIEATRLGWKIWWVAALICISAAGAIYILWRRKTRPTNAEKRVPR